MTDKVRLGFAEQLKFMELHGRFPARHDEVDPNAVQWLSTEILPFDPKVRHDRDMAHDWYN